MKAPKTELVSRAGVHYSGYVFSMSGIIFRETSSSDVGIDGQIELVDDDGLATGMLAGVQIKSGEYFIDYEKRVFSFKSSKKHYEYWANYAIPTLGIVFSPKLKIASWFILDNYSKNSKIIAEDNNSSTISQKLQEINELSIGGDSCLHLINYIKKYYNRPVTTEYLNKIDLFRDGIESVGIDKITAWKRLVMVFFSSNSSPDIVYDTGFRLSWYFPVVTEEQRIFFKTRINKITNKELYNIFRGLSFANENNCDRGFELIIDLLCYNNNILGIMEDFRNSQSLTIKEMSLLNMVIECIEQDLKY
ncbi:DUF4365 domain-containing protein [Xenorhabdus budapestensis]|uniref:DUF4365 domain-containing protein n=1 Tax=Xenorhabdus budapestensis TaxID=290110 RepID=A0A2D0IT71_XENBU|nr:DUF4365 domain-containing protein [Xenorhabdus budapestensis]PHM25103.1 hypothetical protein Xbud_03038 [Xenorhabdus budapestensis]